jgi:hypothetical protein
VRRANRRLSRGYIKAITYLPTYRLEIHIPIHMHTQVTFTVFMQIYYAIDGCLYVCLYVWMYVTKCIVTKLQVRQTSPLAQIYLMSHDNRNRSAK